MRLSSVFEMLIIALLIAFAASRVIDGPESTRTLTKEHRFSVRQRQDQEVSTPSRYCSCSSLTCNCCREFSLPVVPIKGPGCATVSYVRDNVMMITMSFGDRVLRNITVNSKKPKPICMGMPGGVSKFCGRLYSIKKEGDNFKACLGLELRALDDVEAALRVSCFKFGPNGVNVEPGEAIPNEKIKEEEDEDDDDYGFGDLDDDEDDDDFGLTGAVDDDDDDDDDDDERPPAKDTYNDVDSSDSDSDADYTGLSSLSEELFGGFFGTTGNKRKPIVSYDDDDDDDDEDDDDEEEYVADPPKTQIQSQSEKPAQSVPPQVNVVVMQPVIFPTQATVSSRPAVQKRPVKKPVKASSSSPAPLKRVRPTTAAPVKKIRTTPGPVRTLGTTASPSLAQVNNATAKPPAKKKKKPTRTRRPSTPKPISSTSTEATPTVVTATTMTVNVVQGGVLLNQSKPQKVQKPVIEAPLKIPMSKPVIETIPLESEIQSDKPQMTSAKDKESQNANEHQLVADTEKVNEPSESTTQTIMHNTIPVDESIDDGLNPLKLQKVSVKIPTQQQNDEIFVEELMPVGTTVYSEDTTNQYTTVQEALGHTNTVFDTKLRNPDKYSTITEVGTTERYIESTDETINDSTTNKYVKDSFKGENIDTTALENMAATQAMDSTTVSYEMTEEGTDKTETIVDDANKRESPENLSDEEDESEDDDEGIDIGADLGLDDDEDDEEDEKDSAANTKPGEKDDEEDDDILGGLLDDDEDEDDTKEKGQERTLGNNDQYQINPLLYRIARISSGSVATARHLPLFSEGRNRRNNKRMRFPSLEVTS